MNAYSEDVDLCDLTRKKLGSFLIQVRKYYSLKYFTLIKVKMWSYHVTEALEIHSGTSGHNRL